MKTLVLGVGRQGARIVDFLVERNFGKIYINDVNVKATLELVSKYKDRVAVEEKNLFTLEQDDRHKLIKQYDYVVDALPAKYSFNLFKLAVQNRTKMVSVSFLEEDFMALDMLAKENQSSIVPDCGVAPGFSHLLSGYSVNSLSGADSVVMKLGAIPKNPIEPFFHNFTWSIEDLIEEYVRPAKIREDGTVKEVNPFATIVKNEDILGHQLESFITDGTRSFLTSFPDVGNVEERTLRHKGHLNFMKALKNAGLFEVDAITFEKTSIPPYKYLAKVLEKSFSDLPLEDLFVMEIMVRNTKLKRDNTITHQYLLKYDEENQVPALVNSVAITAVKTLELLHSGAIDKFGVLPLESVATKEVYDSLIDAHRSLGAKIEVSRF